MVVLAMLQQGLAEFEKVVWTYAPDVESMSMLQTLCVENNRRWAIQSGYDFKFITNDNYTLFFKDWHEVTSISQLSQLDHHLTKAGLIQLKILSEFGGIWIDSSAMLVQPLSWLKSLNYIRKPLNNPMDNSSVIMFYEPSWFD